VVPENFFRELAEFYCAFQKASPAQLAPLPIQYADYAIWQRERLDDPSLRKQLQYWTQKLQGHPTPVELPTDRPRGLRPSFRGESASRTLSRDLGDCLKELAQSETATLFMVLLAASRHWFIAIPSARI